MKRLLTATLIALAVVAVASADTLKLKNGSSLTGTYLGGSSREVRFIAEDGRVGTHALNDVASIAFGDAVEESASNAPLTITAPQPPSSSSTTAAAAWGTIPEGSVVTVRMIEAIDSDVTDVGQRFRASLEDALFVDGREIAPKGADAIVQVAKVDQAGRLTGREEVALELFALVVNGKEVPLMTNFAELESKSKTAQTAKTAGAGAAVGALIGAVIGGGKGAAIGAATGGGAGTVYSATRGTSVKVPSETLLTFVVREDAKL